MHHGRVLRIHLVRAMSFLALFFMAIAWGGAAESDLPLETISGQVVDMDSIKSLITVRYEDSFTGEAHEKDILVPEDTKIMNGSDAESFLDLEQFDRVTVTYYDDGADGLKAKEILLDNQESRF